MKNITYRFTAHTSTLTAFARNSKKGIVVAIRKKTPGEPNQTGCRQVYPTDKEADATAAVEKLKADALAKGWAEKTKPVRNLDAFTTVPMAPKPPKK